MQGKKRKEKRHTTPVKHTVIIINVIIREDRRRENFPHFFWEKVTQI